MPIWNLSAEVSDLEQAQVDELRGSVDLQNILAYALEIGLGHIQEEFVIKKRERTYEEMRDEVRNFKLAVEKQRIKVTLLPPPKAPANVSSFGNDMTTRRSAG